LARWGSYRDAVEPARGPVGTKAPAAERIEVARLDRQVEVIDQWMDVSAQASCPRSRREPGLGRGETLRQVERRELALVCELDPRRDRVLGGVLRGLEEPGLQLRGLCRRRPGGDRRRAQDQRQDQR